MQPTALRSSIIALAILLTTGCKSPASEQGQEQEQVQPLDNAPIQVASATAPIPVPTPPTDEIVTPPRTQSDTEQILCKDNPLCKTLQTWDAGFDKAGQPMQVVQITLNSTITDRHISNRENRTPYDENNPVPCDPLEYWFIQPTLVHSNTIESQPVLLLKGCHDTNEFFEMGTDYITVEPNRFTHANGGGGCALGLTTLDIELPGFRLLKESHDSSLQDDYGTEHNSTWDWSSMSGKTTDSYDGCSEAPVRRPIKVLYEPILQISIPSNFQNEGWKNTAIGSCKTSVNSQGNKSEESYGSGFVTHGKPAKSATKFSDASFKVVMASPTDIYVEITDDIWIEDAPSILHTDHLELWASIEYCPQSAQNLFQWGITLDANVQTLYGKPTQSPTAERVIIQNPNNTQTYRFKITLPPDDYNALTLVYSDSDDAKTQKRLIATSDVKYRKQYTLGKTKEIEPDIGTCKTQNGFLDYVPGPPKVTSPVITR